MILLEIFNFFSWFTNKMSSSFVSINFAIITTYDQVNEFKNNHIVLKYLTIFMIVCLNQHSLLHLFLIFYEKYCS